ncbi:hypothetical protein H4R19_000750 [Coemansia spiralis]|nr:hypothetical protein H4R19_000750 [Coemansia spiralis]
MFTASVPSYIISSGYSAQQSRRRGSISSRSRFSQASDTASLCSSVPSVDMASDDEIDQDADPSASDIKEVLGYVHTPLRYRAAQVYDTPRLVRF